MKFDKDNTLTAIDLYCGSGAVTEAMKQENIKVLASVDNDPIACSTFRANHPDVYMAEGDIRLLKPKAIRKVIDYKKHINILVVCAPCQPFSNQNRKRNANDPRADLVLESTKFIKEFQPDVVLFENVPGLAGSIRFSNLESQLNKIGYALQTPKYIDAADCGVPQRRTRAIMIASKNPLLFEKFYKNFQPIEKSTVRQSIGELSVLISGEADKKDKLHFSRKHSIKVLERLAHIPKNGGSRNALPDELVLACHKDIGPNQFPDVYGRMAWETQAPTLTTGCTDVTRGRYAHPDQNRAITLREAARLQTFPDTFIFMGNSGEIARQIGNAVPVKMAAVIMKAIKKCFESTEVKN